MTGTLRTPVERLRQRLRGAWEPRPRLTITEVAERFRVLTSEDSNEPGSYRVDRTPYVREPQDRLSPSDPVQIVVLEWAAQLAKSTIGLNWALAVMGYYPAPLLAVFPKEGNATDWSRQRLEPMIAASPLLRDKVAPFKGRSKENTLLSKSFPGGRLRLAGANSPNDLAAMPARYALIEEADRHPRNVSGEGSSTSLVIARQTTYGASRKTLIVSTPTVKGDSEVDDWFRRGDQRYYFIPCPHCGEFQRLDWRDPETGEYRLRWEPGKPETALYHCPFCGCGMSDAEKNLFLPAGQWRPSRPDLGEGGTVTSYHLNGLYSPHGWLSWVELAREWEQASALAKAGSVEKLRSFVNVRLSETFETPGDVLDPGVLARRVEASWGNVIPDGVKVIVIGVDVQDDRIEALILGVGLGLEMWILDYRVILSDPIASETWESLDEVIRSRYTRADGATLAVRATVIDSGHRTQQVYDYCRTRQKRGWKVYAVKGLAGKGKPIWDRKVRRSGRYKTLGTFFAVGTDTIKDSLQSYLRIRVPGPGYVHIPEHIIRQVPDFLEQLSSEKRVKTRDKKGRDVWTWIKVAEHARNEAWDTFGYALAGVHCLILGGLRLEAGGAVRPAAPAQSSPTTPVLHTEPKPQTDGSSERTPPNRQPPVRGTVPRPGGGRPPRRAPSSGGWVSGRSPARGGWF